MKAKIWDESNRMEKIKLEIKLLEKFKKDPFEILADIYDSTKKLLFESIKQEYPDITFPELIERAREIVLLTRRDSN
ncbi:MAG: hypothetical protein ACTSX4_07560 [Candidatus Helarchaeota archaeon]